MNRRTLMVWLAVFGWLTSFLVQTGSLSSLDSLRRLQVTHSFWTNEPRVLPLQYPEYGVTGRDGQLNAHYGIGQSLIMLPGDIVGTLIADRLTPNPAARKQMAAFIMCYLTFPVILAAIAVLAFLIVDALGCFTLWESSIVALSLLLGTSLLNYAQVHQENDLLLLTTLGGLYFGIQWARTGNTRPLIWATLSLGCGLLIRLPALLNAMTVAAVLIVIMVEKFRRDGVDVAHGLRPRMLQVLKIAIPILLVFFVIDRTYQVYRFGWQNIATTYYTLWARQILAHLSELSPSAYPPGFPTSTPFFQGFFGAFIAPDASVFIYDPLLLLALVGALFKWRHLTPTWKAMLVSFTVFLVCLAAMLARLTYWAGHTSWGDRYTTVPVEILAMTGFGICLFAVRNRPGPKFALFALLIFSILIQASSLIFTINLETVQASTVNPGTTLAANTFRLPCVPLARAINIKKALLHQPLIASDNQEVREMTEVQLLPFRSSHKLPPAILLAIRFLWALALIAWIACLVRLARPFGVPPPASA